MTDPAGSFVTLAARGEGELRVRASVFLTVAAPAHDETDARALLEEHQRHLHDAAHHCSAWRLRDGVWRANDAGEPSGSAGAPILAAIDGAGLVDCVLVVTRWFGGTRLGVGGLVRAYGEVAALALERAPRRIGTPAVRLRVRYPYEHTSAVMRVLERHAAEEVEHGYTAAGHAARVECTLPRRSAAAFADLLREQTSGALVPETLGERVLYSAV